MTDEQLRAFNRKLLIHWLESRVLWFEAGKEEFPEIRNDDIKPRSIALLSNWQMKVLGSREARYTNDQIERMLERMRKNFYHLWKVLNILYLDEDADKRQLDKWRLAEEGTHDYRKALWHDQAIELMLTVLNADTERLTVVLAPIEGAGDKEEEKKSRRIEGLSHFFTRQQHGATRGEAAKETAAAFGVSLSTVYNWLSWLESI